MFQFRNREYTLHNGRFFLKEFEGVIEYESISDTCVEVSSIIYIQGINDKVEKAAQQTKVCHMLNTCVRYLFKSTDCDIWKDNEFISNIIVPNGIIYCTDVDNFLFNMSMYISKGYIKVGEKAYDYDINIVILAKNANDILHIVYSKSKLIHTDICEDNDYKVYHCTNELKKIETVSELMEKGYNVAIFNDKEDILYKGNKVSVVRFDGISNDGLIHIDEVEVDNFDDDV
jgi:hypothetical protein